MTDEAPSSVTDQKDVGAVLRKAREGASYSIAYVADQIHLEEHVVQAIEANEFDQLPEPVFIRGYIRSYAKLLGIDHQPLIEEIEGGPVNKDQAPIVNKPIKIKSSRLDPIVVWGAVTVLVITIGLVLTWWLQESKEDPVELAEMVEQVDEIELSETIENQTAPQAVQSHQISLGEVSSENISEIQDEVPVTDTIAEATDSETAQDIIEIPVSGGDINQTSLTIVFNEESWAEIFDARKRRLLHGLIKPGATRVVSGQAPFSVFLGNSPGVEFKINGKEYDHSQYIRGNKTARFQIDDTNT